MSNKEYIRYSDESDVLSSPFNTDIERMKSVSRNFKNVDLLKAFSLYYGVQYDKDTVQNFKQADKVTSSFEIGKVYCGTVKEIEKNFIEFSFPGAKEFSIICKESFVTCMDSIQNYLTTHNNKLLFEVREKKNDVYYVSIINGYYKTWLAEVEKQINSEEFINVHIDELVNGGYVGSTQITPLCELTGKNYTSRVFIPGSHIVLNIEHDFEKWVGEDVQIVPQKFVEYKKDFKNGLIENCLVGSRKRMLQIIGCENIFQMYNDFETAKKLAEFAGKEEAIKQIYQGTVTGIINSSGKTGIFVELDGMYITGLMPVDSYDLLDYKPGDAVEVCVKEFESKKNMDPFVFDKNKKHKKVIRCNVRVVFEKA